MRTQTSSNNTWAFIGLCLIGFGYYLDYTIVNTALPTIQRSFHADVLHLQWVMNIFSLIFSMFLITGGRLADLLGRRKMLFISALLFAVATLLAGLSVSIDMLICFRGVQALGAAVIATVILAMLSDLFPRKDAYNKALGIYIGIIGLGLTLGPFVGGVMVSLLSWRWVFFIVLPFILIGLPFCIFYLKETNPKTERVQIDYAGLILLALCVGSLVFAIIHGEQAGWSTGLTIGFFVLSILSGFILFVVERRVTVPMLEVAVFKNQWVMLSAITCIAAGVIIGPLLFFNPLYLSVIRNMPVLWIGLSLAMIPFMQVAISFFFKTIYARFSVMSLCLISIICALIATLLEFSFSGNSPLVWVFISYLLAGVTWGLANASAPCAVNATMPSKQAGAALGTVYTTWNISSSILLALGSVVFSAKERGFIQMSLAQLNFQLTPKVHQLIKTSLSNPMHVKALLVKYAPSHSIQLFNLFKQAFLHGFYSMIFAMSLVLLLLLIMASYLIKRRG